MQEMQGRQEARATMPIAWTIAGFDPSSGAGVTADLMTFAAHGLFPCSAITALTVQSTVGVRAVEPVDAAVLAHTLECLLPDMPPAGVKIGMLGTVAVAEVVGAFLAKVKAQWPGVSVVLDPVLRSSSGRALFPDDGMDALHERVLPYVDWITPNWSELGVLTGFDVRDETGAENAARLLVHWHESMGVVATGGDQALPVELLVRAGQNTERFVGEHVETRHTHGTGCAFSSALLAQLVLGSDATAAVNEAKAYVTGALRRAPGLGGGKGPMGLLWPLQEGSLKR